MNAIDVHGDAVGPTLYYGAGAGELPTASAVVADLMEIARGDRARRARAAWRRSSYLAERIGPQPIVRAGELTGALYLRFTAHDRPGRARRASRARSARDGIGIAVGRAARAARRRPAAPCP